MRTGTALSFFAPTPPTIMPTNEGSAMSETTGTVFEKVVKIGAKIIAHARYAVFQMAEVAVPRDLFRHILDVIGDLRPREAARC